jgi:hypothetical protein
MLDFDVQSVQSIRMTYENEIRELLSKKKMTTPQAAHLASFGQATLYEALRGNYVLARPKLDSLLDVLGASDEDRSRIIALREEAKHLYHAGKPTRRNKLEAERDRNALLDYLAEIGIKADEGPFYVNCIAAYPAGNPIPVFVQQRFGDAERIFGKAMRVMIEFKAQTSFVVVTFPPLKFPDWYGNCPDYVVNLITTGEVQNALTRLNS